MEAYLFLAFLVHAAAAGIKTLTAVSSKKKGVFTRQKLMLMATGTVLAVFLIIHVYTFRFGAEVATFEAADGSMRRRLTELVMRELSVKGVSLFYLVAFSALWYHLQLGWVRILLHLQIPRYLRADVKTLGSVMATAVCLLFSAVLVTALTSVGY